MPKPTGDNLFRAIVGVGSFLLLLTLAGVLVFGRGEPLESLPWFLTTTQGFAVLSALAVAALCFGRFRALGGPWTFWAGLTFMANAILGTFYLLSWPDLLGGRGVIGESSNTPDWFRLLTHSFLVLLVVAALARRPARLLSPYHLVVYAAMALLTIVVGLLSLLFEGNLPTMIVESNLTSSAVVWQSALIAVLAFGVIALGRRYIMEGDRFLAYLALFLTIACFALLYRLIGGQHYDFWWYANRLLYVSAYLVVLFGLLQEGYILYRGERERAQHLAALIEVAQALGTLTDQEEVGRQAVEITAKAVEADAAGLYLREDGTGVASLVASLGMGSNFIERFATVPIDESSLVGQTIMSGRPGVVEIHDAPPHTVESMRALGVRRFAVVPIRTGGRTLGALGVGRLTSKVFADQDIQLLSSIAAQIGTAMERTRLYEQMRSVNERLAVTSIRAKELAEEAEQRADELDALIDSVAEGVTIVDGEGRIVQVNQVGREIWELPSFEAALGVPVESWKFDLRSPDERSLRKQDWPMSRALRGETFAQQEVVYVRADGSRQSLLFAGSAVLDDQGKVVLAVNVYRDITPIRELERQREEFISVVAHDLRGALTSIKGYADLMNRPATRDTLPEQVQRALGGVASGSRRMERMIADLLDVSRIEARRLALDKRTVDLPSLVREIVQRAEEMTKGRSVRIEVHGEIPPVVADPDRIEQVLANLLSNAGKYSYPESEITVEVEPRPGEVMVSVTDLGQGILAEDRERLFTRFHRTRLAHEERVPGLGLGLYIAKGLIEAHGGRIWVDSQPGKYATFRFTLPAERVEGSG